MIATANLAVRARLAESRGRLVRALALEWSARGLIVATSAMLAAGVVRRLLGEVPFDERLAYAGGTAFVILTIWSIARNFPSVRDAAGLLDRAASTRDRFSTALDFAGHEGEFNRLAAEECERYAQEFRVARWLPLRTPWFGLWALAPLCSLALLQLNFVASERDRRPDAAAQAQAEAGAKTLREFAALLAKAAQDRKDDDLARLAEEMKKRAGRIEVRAGKDLNADKLALREMSALAEMLRQMQAEANAAPVSPEELAALAEALARQDSTREAAQSLERGDLAAAGRQLEELLRKLQQRGDASKQMEEIARSMQEQAGKLSEAQRNEVARAMQQAAQAAQAGKSEQVQKLLQRLAELLKQQQGKQGRKPGQQNGEGKGEGTPRPLDAKTLQELINALERMKQGGDAKDALDSAARSLVRIPLPSPAGKPSTEPGEGDLPSGNPGGEQDRGTSDKLFAEKPGAPPTEGSARKLEGMLGDGSSLQEYVQSAGGRGASSRGYRELYEAMAPAAQDAVEQENVPLGSRAYVKRYFEAIRPRE